MYRCPNLELFLSASASCLPQDNCLGLSSLVFMISEMQSSSAQNRLRARGSSSDHAPGRKFLSAMPFFYIRAIASVYNNWFQSYWRRTPHQHETDLDLKILVDPSLLLLDESTSGVAKPSSRMFHMFDKLLLISEGYPVYYGKARGSMEYFSSLTFIPEIAMNPVEFLIDLAAGQKSQTGTEAQLRDQVFPFEKICSVKERKADMYRLSVYYACSTLCDMVAHVFYPTFFMVILYFMAGAGELFGVAVLSIKRAGMIAFLVLMLFLLTGGYYVQVSLPASQTLEHGI
ncbi:hypothetical protein JRO89_XS09G0093000 [Xanthoceras sorbifolium]|uniref:ABC transporter family G domain-containing protein n=1 Tax=Xanthoceras sorbifolium TaxID=99658 RepID=A0ABQ8HKR9_9ROSI|nr:hypothetical protein JRO89_XS09G0093000 [Xanthoceras sorbifolium]